MIGFDAKLAAVIGLSSGHSFAAVILRRLANAGPGLIIAGHRQEKLDSFAADIGAVAKTCDITAAISVHDLFETAAEHGSLQIAVNAAGINHAAPIRKLDADVIRKVVDVHFLGTLLFIKHAAAAIIRGAGNCGSIVSISTLTATVAGEGLALKPDPGLAQITQSGSPHWNMADPASGSTRYRRGNALAYSERSRGRPGGVHFGVAAEGETVYAPISDMAYPEQQTRYRLTTPPRPGVFAVASSGELLGQNVTEDFCGNLEFCNPGISEAVTAIPGAVIAGHMDGRLRICP